MELKILSLIDKCFEDHFSGFYFHVGSSHSISSGFFILARSDRKIWPRFWDCAFVAFRLCFYLCVCRGIRRGVSTSVGDNRRVPALQEATPETINSGVAICRAYQGRAWRALAIIYRVHDHPLDYGNHVISTKIFKNSQS
jgi:hypothetical protein